VRRPEKSDAAVGAAARQDAPQDQEAEAHSSTAPRSQLPLIDLGAASTPPRPDFDPLLDARPANVPAIDRPRLAEQLHRVLAVMRDGAWRTLRELSDGTGAPEASASARLRELRAAGHQVERRRRFGRTSGTYEYRLVPAVP
jgi:hypothetical protein